MPRNLALEVLNQFDNTGTFPVFSLEVGFQQNRNLSDRDRALVTHLVQGVLRWRKRLDWIIREKIHFPFKKLDRNILNILRLAVYQIFFMDRIPPSAAVNEAVKQAKRQGKPHLIGFVNGILREILRDRERLSSPKNGRDPIRYYSILYSYPEWMVKKWIEDLGTDRALGLMAAQNQIPNVAVRTNSLKTERGILIKLLAEEGVEASPTSYSPWGIKLRGLKRPVVELKSHRNGLFHVQGEAAQICSIILGVKPHERILDTCAGLGGKTTHLGELMRNQGFIIAMDINHRNLIKLRETATRLGVTNIYALVSDATEDLENLFKIKFQRILVDAPCSGLGVISKHPDIKWTRKRGDIERLSSLQQRILNAASKVLVSKGKLLYITCTVCREENEQVVEKFLRGNPQMRLENLRTVMPEWGKDLVDENGFYRTYPHIHCMDGFFGALMSKV